MRRNLFKAMMLGAVLWLATVLPAGAGTSFDFLFSMDRVSNDNQLFLNLTVSNLGYDRAVIQPVLPRLAYVEVDLPVVLFLAHESGRPPDFIVDLRSRGLSWAVVFQRCGVPLDVLFVGIDSDPGPPYGKAWGHWKRERRGTRLSDRDITGLVQVQLGSRWAGTRPLELARAHGQGRSVATIVAERKGRPYRDASHADGKPGKGRGHGKH